MAYPETCFVDLIGIKGICNPYSAVYWLDDIPGIDLPKLAQAAEQPAPTGEKLGLKTIESAARLVIADIEAIYDASYKVQPSLVNGCSICTFTSTYGAGVARGILIKNNTTSSFSSLVLDKLTAKMNSTGTFNIIITDGEKSQTIEWDFVAGFEYDFINIGFETKRKQIKVYLNESDGALAKLSCPSGSGGCGCSGPRATYSDLSFHGLAENAETQNAWGFIPCAFIRCNAEDLICFIAKAAPRMVGMALLYKAAELYFSHTQHSQRNNRTAGMGPDHYKNDIAYYQKVYKEKLQGVGTRGVKDIVFSVLQQNNDVCVVCNSIMSTAWATG